MQEARAASSEKQPRQRRCASTATAQNVGRGATRTARASRARARRARCSGRVSTRRARFTHTMGRPRPCARLHARAAERNHAGRPCSKSLRGEVDAAHRRSRSRPRARSRGRARPAIARGRRPASACSKAARPAGRRGYGARTRRRARSTYQTRRGVGDGARRCSGSGRLGRPNSSTRAPRRTPPTPRGSSWLWRAAGANTGSSCGACARRLVLLVCCVRRVGSARGKGAEWKTACCRATRRASRVHAQPAPAEPLLRQHAVRDSPHRLKYRASSAVGAAAALRENEWGGPTPRARLTQGERSVALAAARRPPTRCARAVGLPAAAARAGACRARVVGTRLAAARAAAQCGFRLSGSS
jgi:hypothetical protein